MQRTEIIVQSPKLNVKKAHHDCRCTDIEVTTEHHDVMVLRFDSIDDAKAFHGLLGYALGMEPPTT